MKTPDSGSSELAKQNPGGILRKSPKASLEDDFKMPLEGTDVLVNEYCVIQKYVELKKGVHRFIK